MTFMNIKIQQKKILTTPYIKIKRHGRRMPFYCITDIYFNRRVGINHLDDDVHNNISKVKSLVEVIAEETEIIPKRLSEYFRRFFRNEKTYGKVFSTRLQML